MADALMKYETIDRFQIDEIMQGRVPNPPRDWVSPPSSNEGSSEGGNTAVKDEPTIVTPPLGTAAPSH